MENNLLTFLNIGQQGRLGNQLFQYATLVGIAKKRNLVAKIPDISSKYWHGQKCLLNEFNISCPVLASDDKIICELQDTTQSGFYNENFEKSIVGGTSICGYFQNTKYFSNIEQTIKKELLPKKHYIDSANEYVQSVGRGKKVVSVHVRRGDNTDGTNPSFGLYGKDPLDKNYIWGAYFAKVKEILFKQNKPQDYTFLVFVGGSRSGNDADDIEWAKLHWNYDGFQVSDSNDPMVDFSRMLCCDINVVAHMSSFGWWSAYLNPNQNKQVIAPMNYFLDKIPQHRDGFYPKEWILL